MKRFSIAFGISVAAASAHAQLVFGHTYYNASVVAQTGAQYLDITSGQTTQLWTGAGSRKVNGIAANDATGKMYANDSARLLVWNYGTAGTQPTQINGLYRRGHDGLTYATGVDDLALANGSLYGYTTFNVASGGAGNVDDGIYRIDPTITTSGTVNMTLIWTHADQEYNFQGLAFNAADGMFYGANQTGNNHTAGIYKIDALGTGTVTSFLPLPSDLTSADGIVFGGGYLWVSQKISANPFMTIRGYNLVTSAWDKTFTFGTGLPTTSSYATGLTWTNANVVPEPMSMIALALGAAGLLRRRSKG